MPTKLSRIDMVWINPEGKFAQIRPVPGHGTFVYYGDRQGAKNIIRKYIFKGYQAIPRAQLLLYGKGFQPWMPLIEID